MKKTILSLALLLVVGGTLPTYAQRHRHTSRTTAVAQTQQSSAKASSANQQDADELVAYSDTTSVDTSATAQTADDDESDIASPHAGFLDIDLGTETLAGGMITLVIGLFILLFLFLPFVFLFLIMRYIIRRHNDRVRLAEKAMESGYPLNDEQMPLSRKSPEYVWRRGVRNVSIGVGVMLFLWFLGAQPLMGIGALMACIGLGQMFMARFNYDSKIGRKKADDDIAPFADQSDDIAGMQFDNVDAEKGKK